MRQAFNTSFNINQEWQNRNPKRYFTYLFKQQDKSYYSFLWSHPTGKTTRVPLLHVLLPFCKSTCTPLTLFVTFSILLFFLSGKHKIVSGLLNCKAWTRFVNCLSGGGTANRLLTSSVENIRLMSSKVWITCLYHYVKPLSHLAALPLRQHGVVKFPRAPWDRMEIWFDLSEDGDVTAFSRRSHDNLGVSTKLHGVPTAY